MLFRRPIPAFAAFAPLVALLLCSAVEGQQPAIRWETNLKDAQQRALESNRLVLIHFWAPWCGPCRQMDEAFLEKPTVLRALCASYVPIKLNADFAPAVARKYGVNALPTDAIITPDGELVTTLPGTIDETVYLSRLGQVALAAQQRGLLKNPALVTAPQDAMPPAGGSGIGISPAAPYANGVPAMPMGSPQLAATQAMPTAPQTPPYATGGGIGIAPGAPGVAGATTAPPWQPANQPPTPNGFAADHSPAPAVAPPYAANAQPAASGRPTAELAGNAPPMSGMAPPIGASAPAPNAGPAPAYSLSPPVAMGGAPVSGPPSADAAATPPASAAPTAVPAGNPPLGLEGFCPVELAENKKWIPGDPRWGVIHRQRTYLFSSSEAQQRFWADPDHFAPALSGTDVVLAIDRGQSVAGMRKHGVFFGNQVFLFSSEETLQAFWQAPERYASAALQAMKAPTSAIR